jgi:hypothetical protein
MRAKFVNEISLSGTHLERMSVGWSNLLKKMELYFKELYNFGNFDIKYKDGFIIIHGFWNGTEYSPSGYETQHYQIVVDLKIDVKTKESSSSSYKHSVGSSHDKKHKFESQVDDLDWESVLKCFDETMDFVQNNVEFEGV